MVPGNDDDRLEVIRQLAHCAQITGQYAQAEQALLELAQTLSEWGPPLEAAAAERSLATVYAPQGKWNQAGKARGRAQSNYIAARRPAEAGEEALAPSELLGGLHLHDALDSVRIAGTYGNQVDRKDLIIRSLGLEGYILSMFGKPTEGRRKAEDALSRAPEGNLGELASEAYQRLGKVLEYSSNYPEAIAVYDTAVSVCQQFSAELIASSCLGCMAYVLFRLGDWNRARTTSMPLLRNEDATPTSRGAAALNLALIHLVRGNPRKADPLLRNAT